MLMGSAAHISHTPSLHVDKRLVPSVRMGIRALATPSPHVWIDSRQSTPLIHLPYQSRSLFPPPNLTQPAGQTPPTSTHTPIPDCETRETWARSSRCSSAGLAVRPEDVRSEGGYAAVLCEATGGWPSADVCNEAAMAWDVGSESPRGGHYLATSMVAYKG